MLYCVHVLTGSSHPIPTLSPNPLSQDRQISCLSDSLSTLATSMGISVPPDYLSLSLEAMTNLQNSGRSN